MTLMKFVTYPERQKPEPLPPRLEVKRLQGFRLLPFDKYDCYLFKRLEINRQRRARLLGTPQTNRALVAQFG